VQAPILTAMGIDPLGDPIISALLGPYLGGTLAATGATSGLWLRLRGVGGLLGTIPAAHLSRWIRPHRIIAICLTGGAAMLVLMAAVPRPAVAMGAAIGLGIFVTGWITNQQYLIQRTAPDSYLGRLFGIQGTISATGMIVGSVAAGTMADLVGIQNMLFLAAAGYLAGSIWLLVRYKSRPTLQ
jgi:predicted MFS family arabinose efflux permease